MEQNRDDLVTFELMERIPLEELSSDIAVIRNVEVTPEIEMIAEYSSYRIRGALIFTGEYEARKEDEADHPHLLDRSAYYNKRLVRKINHRIPVDISLPADRIDDNGVVMEITSLDYDLAEPNHLVVTTELELQGVLKEDVVKNAYWDQATQYDYADRDQEEDTSQQKPHSFANEYNVKQEQPREFHFEAQPIKEDQAKEPYYYVEEEHQIDRDPTYEDFHHHMEQDVPVSEESDNRPVEDPIALEDQVEQDEQLDGRIEEDEIPVYVPVEEREPEVKVTISNKNRPVESNATKDAENRMESAESKEEREKASRANSVSLLSKFLKNREDTMTQLQVCIVQPGETIAEIAKRYNIQEEDIRTTNNLGFNSNVSGRVLKIPTRKVR